ncbi:34897_t:CDS:1, partial [Gigaspora margarita]
RFKLDYKYRYNADAPVTENPYLKMNGTWKDNSKRCLLNEIP